MPQDMNLSLKDFSQLSIKGKILSDQKHVKERGEEGYKSQLGQTRGWGGGDKYGVFENPRDGITGQKRSDELQRGFINWTLLNALRGFEHTVQLLFNY